MKRTKRIIAVSLVAILFGTFGTIIISSGTDSASAVIVRAGSSKEDIKMVQQKLKNLGYYTAAVDGIYGSRTTAAVRKFQQDNRLKVDGIVGSQTLGALGLSVGSSGGGNTVSAATIRAGSSKEDIKKVQQKLKTYGDYKLAVDGIYGSGTIAAVKNFQQRNGLTVDGIVGAQTLRALGLSSSSSSGSTNSNTDLHLLAKCVYAEARGEPYVGRVAVAAVILNRVKHPDFPNTIAGVVYQPYAFTAVADGQINLNPDSEALRAAQDALNGWDPTYGCIYYYNPAVATSKWIFSRKTVTTIGKHVFAV